MEKVIIYSKTENRNPAGTSPGGFAVKNVSSIRSLVEALAEEPSIAGICVHPTDEDFPAVLASIHATFPRLNICVLTGPAYTASRVEGCRYITADSPEDSIREAEKYFANMETFNQREYNRFSWPLKVAVRFDGGEWESHRVHSLSAGGTFLATSARVPPPGSACEMIVEFQNCRLHTRAEVLDARQSSSNLPFGFGVRFVGLEPESAALVNKIVQNALVKRLLDPGQKSEIPSIGEEELTLQFEIS